MYREIEEEAEYDEREIELFGGDMPLVPNDDGKYLRAPAYMDRHPAADREHVGMVYFGRVLVDREPKKSAEHTEMMWLTQSELANATQNRLKRRTAWYANTAINRTQESR